VACGALAPFALISVGKNIKIMVADPASKDGFVQIMIKPYGVFIMFTKFPAFEVHDPYFSHFIFGPGCRYS
jgi:hypothetical protein